jgi:hypothetical protein
MDILGPGFSKGACLDRLLGPWRRRAAPFWWRPPGNTSTTWMLLEYAHISITMEDAREPLLAMAT